jgi:hypothetical protein
MQNGWVYSPVISDYENYLFFFAMRRNQDIYRYYPIAVAKREEVGTKYRFLCIAVPKKQPDTPSHFADIGIYKPAQGLPYPICLYCQDFESIFPCRPY